MLFKSQTYLVDIEDIFLVPELIEGKMNLLLTLNLIGWILIILGVVAFFLAAIMLFFSIFSRRRTKRVRGGGLIMLGPIPIIFGTDLESVKALIALAVMLVVIMLILVLVFAFLFPALR